MTNEGLCDARDRVVQPSGYVEPRDLNPFFGVLPQRVRGNGELDVLASRSLDWFRQDYKFLHLRHALGQEAAFQFALQDVVDVYKDPVIRLIERSILPLRGQWESEGNFSGSLGEFSGWQQLDGFVYQRHRLEDRKV